MSHFAHHSTDCGVAYESAVHILAKDILKKQRRIMLPYLRLESSRLKQIPGTFRAQRKLVERQPFIFDDAELEPWMDGRIPDVVLNKRDRKLLVEIVVTHDITDDKLAWIRSRDLATIRVWLGWADQAISESQLQQCLLSGRNPYGFNIVTWVHHPKQAETQAQLDSDYLRSVDDGTVSRPQEAAVEAVVTTPSTNSKQPEVTDLPHQPRLPGME